VRGERRGRLTSTGSPTANGGLSAAGVQGDNRSVRLMQVFSAARADRGESRDLGPLLAIGNTSRVSFGRAAASLLGIDFRQIQER